MLFFKYSVKGFLFFVSPGEERKMRVVKFLQGAYFTGALVALFMGPGFAAEDNDNVNLDKVVVTPFRYDEILNKTPASVTVINQSDIINSNAPNTVSILRYIPGIVVRDFYGNGEKATVDVAGFGEQGQLNTLVLVDGRRVNEADLSGVNWAQVPLDQIERVEVIPGGTGSVLYGDNASAGVINIITKKGTGKPKVGLKVTYGSYDANSQKISLDGVLNERFSYLLAAQRDSTNGYRENTFDKINDFTSKLGYNFNDMLSARFSSGFHASTYGLPSGLFQHFIDANGRRWARYSNDHANNKDYYFVLGGRADASGLGFLDMDFNYRQDNTDSYFPSSGNDTRKNRLETFGLTPKYTLGNSVFDHENKLISGVDITRTFYRSDNYVTPSDAVLKNYTNIRKDSLGAYIQDEFSLFKQLVIAGGYRYEGARYAFDYHDFTGFNPDMDSKIYPAKQAFNSGVAYNYADDSSAFFNISRSFRFPEVDEFIGMYDINFHQFLNTDLKPQSSLNYQVGARHKFNPKLKASLSLFRMNVRDYIYFNPNGGIYGFGENENYGKSVHEGVEFSFDSKLTDRLGFYGNYTFTRAFFKGGIYGKNDIPMVPRNKATVGLRLSLPRDFTLNLTGNYVGERYFINDEANAVGRLNGYMVADTNLSWNYHNLTVIFAINNLFNREYSEYGVYGSDSSQGFAYDKCYFPSPGRNFSLKAEYSF